MALNTNDFQFNPAAAAEAEASAAAGNNLGGFPPAQPKEENKIMFSFSNGTGFEDSQSLHTGSAVMMGLKKTMEEKFKDTNMYTRVVPMLRESFGEKFRYSSLIVTAANLDRSSGTMNVAYYILLVESSNPTKPENFRNNSNVPTQQINIPRFAADGIDAGYVAEARRLVEASYSSNPGMDGAKRVQAIYASSMCVPDTFPLDNPEKIGVLAVNSLMAVANQLKRLSTQPAFNLQLTEPTPFTIEHIFRDGSIQDLNDRPVRTDVIVKTVARNQVKRNAWGLNGGSDGSPVALTSLFIDTVYTGRAAQTYNHFKPKTEVTPCFAPRAVITNNINYKGASQEMFLLSLYGAFSIYESGAAKRSLANKQVKKGDLFDMTDIGALNVLANLGGEAGPFGSIYSVRGNDVQDAFKYSLIESALHPVPLMAIDCEVSGPSSWATSLWQQASGNSAEAKRATALIIGAAMNLTNGNFASFWDDKQPLVIDRQIVPMGYWEDLEGNIRDIREFDTLAVLNRFGESSPEIISRWVQSQYNKQLDELVRLTTAISVIDDVSSTRARHTGRALRVTPNPAFVNALSSAIKLMDQHTFTSNDMFSDVGNHALQGADFLNWSQMAANASLGGSAFNKAGMDQILKNNMFANLFSV